VSGLLVGSAGPASPGLAGPAASDSAVSGGAGAIALGVIAALLFALGSLIERHRAQAVL
jgi:hypothetical protein